MKKMNKLVIEEINRYINNIICESQESSSQKKAKKLAMENGLSPERAEKFVRVDLRNDITSLRDRNAAKFTLGCARLFFERQLTDAESIGLINNIIALIAKKYIDKFDQNLNNLSLNELSNQFSSELEEIEQQNRNDVNSKTYENKGYEIVPINSFEEAQEYSKYTDIGEKYHWCLTYRENMWNSYTKEGINQVYFCLKNGFENIEPHPTGDPMDEYGLSMISVIVDGNGRLAHCTLRWNHGNNAKGDDALTVQELSDIVGVNFYETFKPNNKWEKLISDIKQQLANGEDPYFVFDDCQDFENGFAIVELKDKYNFIDRDYNLLSPNLWFDYCKEFENGFAVVEINNKVNYLDTNGKILSSQWFDKCWPFNENELARVQLNDKHNFINTNGEILNPNQWFNRCEGFFNGFSQVVLYGKGCNFINENGEILSDQWFENCWPFNENGLARVELNDKYNIIDTNGNLISDINKELIKGQWFDACGSFDENGLAMIRIKDKGFNFINSNGKLLSQAWFDSCNFFNNGFTLVKLNKGWYYIDTNGKIQSTEEFAQNVISKRLANGEDPRNLFDYCNVLKNGFTKVKLNNKYNFIDTNNKIVSYQWFDKCDDFINGFAIVEVNKKNNFIDTNGNILNPNQWFDLAYIFREGFAGVLLINKGWNFIDKNGNYLSDQWFDDINNFNDGFGTVTFNDKWNYIDKNGNYLSSQWFDFAHIFNKGFGKIELNGKTKLIDANGNISDAAE